MSFITDVESELAKAENELAKWWGKEPALENVVSIGVTTIGAALETVFTIEGNGPAATLVGDVVSKAQQDLLAVDTLVTTVGAAPTLRSILDGIVTNISGLASAANITDPKSLAALKVALTTAQTLANSFAAAVASVSVKTS